MKLRIRGNTLRLRLLRSEVSELEKKGVISEAISFGASSQLVYSIKTDDVEEIGATFEANTIVVTIPTTKAREWFGTELVGLEAEEQKGEDKLGILVEKDFVCLTRTDDPDNLDAYPNPDEANC